MNVRKLLIQLFPPSSFNELSNKYLAFIPKLNGKYVIPTIISLLNYSAFFTWQENMPIGKKRLNDVNVHGTAPKLLNRLYTENKN